MKTCTLYLSIFSFLLLGSCISKNEKVDEKPDIPLPNIELLVLGTVQDAGSPQIACKKSCCKYLWSNPDPTRKVVSLGLIDRVSGENFLFEASPDIKSQIAHLNEISNQSNDVLPTGVFITHAHIGHYTGLIQFGREALGGDKIPVYGMPRFLSFLRYNGPWSQLVELENIHLIELQDDSIFQINERLSVRPIQVPHRDEFSETVGFEIVGPNKRVLFIPDIDKWSKWKQSIVEMVKAVDYALIDATFFDNNELPGRDMSEIPHPFVVESMDLFKEFPSLKSKIRFIHLNHTNPLLNKESKAFETVIKNGFTVAQYGERLEL